MCSFESMTRQVCSKEEGESLCAANRRLVDPRVASLVRASANQWSEDHGLSTPWAGSGFSLAGH